MHKMKIKIKIKYLASCYRKVALVIMIALGLASSKLHQCFPTLFRVWLALNTFREVKLSNLKKNQERSRACVLDCGQGPGFKSRLVTFFSE